VSIDLERNRIALTMRTGPASEGRGKEQGAARRGKSDGKPDAKAEKQKPAAPAVPKPGTIAPNGMRFR